MKKTSFKILNDTGSKIEIIHEPECFEFNLPENEEIEIETGACKESILIRASLEEGRIVLSVLDENSLYSVSNNGEDVFKKYLD